MPFTPFLKSFNLFTEAEILKIQNSFSPISFEEQDIMLHEGEICVRIFYISEGVLREFSYDESEHESTLTHWILGEGEWVYQAMFQNNPPPAIFKLLRPSRHYTLEKKQ